MSRTYVHVPPFVKERSERFKDYFREFHDHSKGSCELELYLEEPNRWLRTSCRLDLVNRGRNIWCGCKMCTGGYLSSRTRQKRERAHWRSIKQDLLKTATDDYEDIDVPPFCDNGW